MASFTRLLVVVGLSCTLVVLVLLFLAPTPTTIVAAADAALETTSDVLGTSLPRGDSSAPFMFTPNTTWRTHRSNARGKTICFEDLQAWMPCKDSLRCERKRRMSFPCRPSVFYDNDVWDFCNPMARLNKSVYTMHPPLHVVNNTVSDSDAWQTLSLPLREAWTHITYSGSHVPPEAADASTVQQASDAEHDAPLEETGHCPPHERRAIVGFAAKFMRPFQVIAIVLSAFRAMGRREQCTRMHLFVTDPHSPLLLHLQAVTSANRSFGSAAMHDLSPAELAEAKRQGKLNRSFLVLEPFQTFESRVFSLSGNNRRVEVVRINIIRWWLRHGSGRGYRRLLFADTRDVVFMGDVFHGVSRTLLASGALTSDEEEYVYAATEEFPFFRQPRLGMQWNTEVHSTTFGYEMMTLMQKFHLDDYPYMRLINSGVYGGTYDALLDLFEIWGRSAAAVFTETFGVDQPLLGGLFYFGLRMTKYPHKALLLSGSDGPLRHLYTDGGTEPIYPFMRLELHNNTRMWSDEFFRRVAAPSSSDLPVLDGALLDHSLTGGLADAPSPHHLNCRGERYAVIHQSDRYPLMWLSLTAPIAAPTIAWAKTHGVEWTWGPRKVGKRKRGGRGL